MKRLVKGENVKILDDNSSLIPLLKHEGWSVDGEELVNNELEELRAIASNLGLKPHHKAGVDKIREMIAKAQGVEG